MVIVLLLGGTEMPNRRKAEASRRQIAAFEPKAFVYSSAG
jgi:hypothetical protein